MATDETLGQDQRQEGRRIAAAVYLLLDQHGISQGELAGQLRLTRSSLNRSLNPEGSRPRRWQAREINEMALFFDVPMEFFFAEGVEEEYRALQERVNRDYAATVERVRRRLKEEHTHDTRGGGQNAGNRLPQGATADDREAQDQG